MQTSDGRMLICVAACGTCESMDGIIAPVERSSVRAAWANEKPTFVENLQERAHNPFVGTGSGSG